MGTHASNSTTKPRVGQFIGQVVLHYHHHHSYHQHHIHHNYPTHKHNDYHQGIHIGQASALPLPLLPICGESREDIAAQLGMGLEILSAVSGVAVAELAGQVDTLLTDSTEHNKGVNVIVQELYELDKPAGQIFCGTHTTLGFSNAMNSMVLRVELKMGLDKVLSNFMCSMELDTEFKHNSWNYFGQFTLFYSILYLK